MATTWLSRLRHDMIMLLPCSFHSGTETVTTTWLPPEDGVTVRRTVTTCLTCGRKLRNGLSAGPDSP